MKEYIVGIDLGTSNVVVAYAKNNNADNDEDIRLFEIDQLVDLGEVAAKPLLPSVRYHAAPGELRPEDLQLPWTAQLGADATAIGCLARDLGAQAPGRLVSSAKSWLSHAAVDRLAPILPWGAAEDVEKISPVAASASYLAHVRAAWNHRFPQAPLESQEIVLTVPASFDEGARALTVEAAHRANLPHLRLLEEPQAAFYDWLFRHRRTLADELQRTRLVLVCDVGGGTTDLSLIQVEMHAGEPRLTRIGVGDHLMLGGDNMDLALAHRVEARMTTANQRLSAARLSQLMQRCRSAKEQLLAADAPDRVAVTLLGAGAKLIGGARSVELTREEVGEAIVNGFFPRTAADELPQRRRSGIVEFGLPYPADPAITRHLAEFLNRHAEASRQALGETEATTLPIPDTLLFNGGVFRAASLTQRVEDILGDWRGAPLQVLHNDTPDLAVARGAVAYALIKQGRGPKIGGGSARSYFLVLQDDAQKKTGICVLPRGTEEGHEIRLTDRVFSLRLGQPVRFHLVSSIGDAAYRAGEVVELDNDDFIRLPPIATVVPAREGGGDARKQAPVQLGASMTEVGTLEIYCVGIEEPRQRWRLEFQLRGDGAATISYDAPRLPPQFAAAIERIGLIFGSRSQQVPPKEVKQLRMQLETLLGKREHWDSALLRALFDSLWDGAKRRRRSAEHERLWFSLASYCIRPGFGYALDDWRMEKLWSLYDQGIQYGSERQNWAEWWILWRRAAGGLAEAAQLRVFEALSGALQPEDGKTRATGGSAAYDDIVRLAASLERLPVARKIDIGAWLLERLKKPTENINSWWAVGRIGARAPLYGSAHTVVLVEVAIVWLEAILALDWKKVEPAAFAATQIARMTGDRLRDLPHDVRCRVVARLQAINASPTWVAMVDSVVEIDEADERRAFGESLPPGLKLIEN